jgi:hypothetical protein
MGNTMLLATVVSNKEGKEGADFLPLSVDYQEKFASTGKIPGGFLYPDEAIPKAVQWLTARGVAMPSGGPPAPTTPDVPRCGGERGFSRCAYAKGHPGPCSFQHADYLGGYDR